MTTPVPPPPPSALEHTSGPSLHGGIGVGPATISGLTFPPDRAGGAAVTILGKVVAPFRTGVAEGGVTCPEHADRSPPMTTAVQKRLGSISCRFSLEDTWYVFDAAKS